MKIALVIGHDADKRGAYGSEGVSEWNFNDVLINDLFFRGLPNKHTYRRFYRDADIKGYSAQMIDLHKRIDAWGAELSIEFHFNSFSNKNVRGHEVLYCSIPGAIFANKLNECLDNHLPTSNRGIKKVRMHPRPKSDDNGAGFCCRGKSKAIIIEPYFAANQYRFVHNGDLRDDYINAINEFMELI